MISSQQRREQGGSALVVTVLLLVLMGIIGVAALDTVMRDEQVAGHQKRSHTALYAAEAGVADAKDRLRTVFDTGIGALAFPNQAGALMIGNAADYPYGRPRYFGDPAAGGTPIVFMNAAAEGLETGNNQAQGGEMWLNTMWRIRVQGQTAGGASARLDVVATKQLSGGNAY